MPEDADVPPQIGKAAVTRTGRDLTLIGYSRMAHVAAEVAEQLAATEGIDIEVIDLRSLRPLDRETIVESVKKTHAAVVLEDDWLTYGIGAEIAATISDGAFDYLDAPGPPGRDGRGADALRQAAGDRRAAVARTTSSRPSARRWPRWATARRC